MKALLTRRVPDLQFDLLSSQLDGFDFEVDADGGDEGVVEGIVGEAEENAGLAHAGVADQQQFEQEVVAFLGHRYRPETSLKGPEEGRGKLDYN